MSVGACKLPLGGSCLVVLGHLVSCYAQDFAPLPAVVEAYLQLLSHTASLASKERCSPDPGRHIFAHEGFEVSPEVTTALNYCHYPKVLAAMCCANLLMT